MGYHLNRLDEPFFIAVSKPLLTEFGIDLRLESCETFLQTLHLDEYFVKIVPNFHVLVIVISGSVT